MQQSEVLKVSRFTITRVPSTQVTLQKHMAHRKHLPFPSSPGPSLHHGLMPHAHWALSGKVEWAAWLQQSLLSPIQSGDQTKRHVRAQPFPHSDGDIYSPAAPPPMFPTTMETLTFHGKVCLPVCSSGTSWTPDSR